METNESEKFVEGDIDFYFKQFEDGFQARCLAWLGDGALHGLGENEDEIPKNTVECVYKEQKCYFLHIDHTAGILVLPESEFDNETQKSVLIEQSEEGMKALQQLINNPWIEPDPRMPIY